MRPTMSLDALLKEAYDRGFVIVTFSMTAVDSCDCTLSGGVGSVRLLSSGGTPKEALRAALAALRTAGSHD